MCVFCKIIAGEIPSTKYYEDDEVLAIQDINPQAPTHILVLPKAHIESAAAITAENSRLVAKCFEVIAKLIHERGMEDCARVVNNCGADAGQTVQHLHFHLLGGKKMGENIV